MGQLAWVTAAKVTAPESELGTRVQKRDYILSPFPIVAFAGDRETLPRSRLQGGAQMRRFFFDIRDGGELIPDEEGEEFSTLDAVQDEAAHALADMAKDDMRHVNGNGSVRHLAIEVRDEHGPVMLVNFSFEIRRLQ
jgi:hypothetical protein